MSPFRSTVRTLGLLLLMTAVPPLRADDTVDDPHLWLEDVTGEKPLAWVRERNAESTRSLAGGNTAPAFTAVEDRIRSILDSKARIPVVMRIGDHLYNFWRDEEHPRGLWRRTWRASRPRFVTRPCQWR